MLLYHSDAVERCAAMYMIYRLCFKSPQPKTDEFFPRNAQVTRAYSPFCSKAFTTPGCEVNKTLLTILKWVDPLNMSALTSSFRDNYTLYNLCISRHFSGSFFASQTKAGWEYIVKISNVGKGGGTTPAPLSKLL